jgi:osmotically-inducible protein OsmY
MKPKFGTFVGVGSLTALLALSPLAFAQAGGAMDNPAPAVPPASADSGAAMGNPIAAQPSDASLTSLVKEALKSDQSTMDAQIHVSAKDGVVTLKGKVDSKATADHAQQTAASVSGVKSVDNQLKVSERG